ncbi:hypothetical protein J2X03_003813 [Microbacterium trichothecenolyticum]|uniref:hypothetical protein n=1 Tax=Microbacterium trichothecenolyticum TaxID=69370 RepID=UPI002855B1B5|nr:hypothetical protein [Microbacterium trichothecenolyticum]MDR7113911.1 hypothetical protein [Microbacterium trichothecenolyticum]
MITDPATGVMVPVVPGFDVVPLNVAILDEEMLAQWAPSPVQIRGALTLARAKNMQAPGALNAYREKLRAAEREQKIALGLALRELRKEFGPRATMTELRDLAHGVNERLMAANDAVDEAWLLLEYAKDFAEAIERDVSLLQSIAKSLRGEQP